MYNYIALILFVLYWNKPIYIYYSCASTVHARYIQIAGLGINHLQLITNYNLQLYALWAQW